MRTSRLFKLELKSYLLNRCEKKEDEDEYDAKWKEKKKENEENGIYYDLPSIYNNWRKTPRKGRQGRSRETRKRKREEKEKKKTEDEEILCSGNNSKFMDDRDMLCSNKQCRMQMSMMIFDHKSGDLICGRCGIVVCEKGYSEYTYDMTNMHPSSKPYQRVVHFRQRLAQLLTIDPLLSTEFLDECCDFVCDNGEDLIERFGPIENWGIESWKKILAYAKNHKDYKNKYKILNSDIVSKDTSKVAIHWLQLRRYCFIDPWKVELTPEIIKELDWRYSCVSKAFDATLRGVGVGGGEEENTNETSEPSPPLLNRKNIINVNYTMAQLLRLTSKPDFDKYACFIPQQKKSSSQPETNNQRWKILMEYCQKKFSYSIFFMDKGKIDWTFHPITRNEVETIFSRFI